MRTQADDRELDVCVYNIVTQFGHCTAVVLPRVVATEKGHSNRGYSLSALRTLRAMQKASASEAYNSIWQARQAEAEGIRKAYIPWKILQPWGPMYARKQEGGQKDIRQTVETASTTLSWRQRVVEKQKSVQHEAACRAESGSTASVFEGVAKVNRRQTKPWCGRGMCMYFRQSFEIWKVAINKV